MVTTLQDNIISIDFGNETKVKTPEIHQYDWGIKISFVNVADGNIVQFSNVYTETSIDKEIKGGEVEIPSSLIENFATINAYVRIVDENYEIITKEIEIPVKKVAKPSDVIPSDESNKPIVEQLRKEIDNKQDKLVAGDNISIKDNVISVTDGKDVEIPEVNYKHNYKVEELTDNKITSQFTNANFELGYTYRYDGDYSVFSEAVGTVATYHNPIIICTAKYTVDGTEMQILEIQSITVDENEVESLADMIVADRYINSVNGSVGLIQLVETDGSADVDLSNYDTSDEVDAKISKVSEIDMINEDIVWQIGAYSLVDGIYTENATNTRIRPSDFIRLYSGDTIVTDEGYAMTILVYSTNDPSAEFTMTSNITSYEATEDCWVKLIMFTYPTATTFTDSYEVSKHIHITHKYDAFSYTDRNVTLQNKRISILGDSTSTYGGNYTTDDNGDKYSDGEWCYLGNRVRFPQGEVQNVNNMWWKKILNKYEMVYGVNESWAGSCITWDGVTESTTEGADIHCASWTRINHLGENGIPNYIFISAGGNDILQGVDLGVFDTTNPSTLTEDEIKALPVDTFANAVRTMIIRLQYLYPNAKLVYILPYYVNVSASQRIDKYSDMINEICNYFGVPTVDSRLMGMTIWNRSKYLISDSVHLNNVGMDLLFKQIDDTLNSTKVSGGVSKTTVETMITEALNGIALAEEVSF